jgi:glycine cleavage system H protein
MRRFSREHLWVDVDSDGHAAVGITDYGAKTFFGGVARMRLLGAARELARNEDFIEVDAPNEPHNANMLVQIGQGPVGGLWRHVVKAPLACGVVESNEMACAQSINEDPEGAGWIARIRIDPTEFESLLDRAAYDEFCDTMEKLKTPLPSGWIND